ncbi:MAG TPA: DNA alkylation repair protein [Flavobacteriales bacterium]
MATRKTLAKGAHDVDFVLDWMKAHGTKQVRESIGPRFGIVVDKSFGTTMAQLKQLAKITGRDQALSLALWETGWYDARMFACLIGEPKEVTAAQMDAWCKDFDNWATCDTACFALFDRTPHAFAKIEQWAKRKPEFQRRAAFALLASVAGHLKDLADAPFLDTFPLIEAAANDERNFVKKGVSWALRSIAGRSTVLHDASVELAERLAASKNATERWVGKDVLRDISRPLVVARAAKNEAVRNRKARNTVTRVRKKT